MRWRGSRVAGVNWKRFRAELDEMYKDLTK